jgi:hypothetical protein
MRKTVFTAVFVLAALVSAQEQPGIPGQIPALPTDNVRLDRTPVQSPSPVGPVWTSLARMAPAERANARIDIGLSANATSEALALARITEANWNDGRYGDALAGFESLARLTGPTEMAVGCSWRTPIPTVHTDLWGDNVRIGNRDSVRLVSLDEHRPTGHLFAVLLYDGDGAVNSWSVNFSNDGGQTWHETYTYSAEHPLIALSASVLANHCYISFGRCWPSFDAQLYRCRASDGMQENFHNGSSYVTLFNSGSPDTIKEVALTGDQDFSNYRLYCTAITRDGHLKFLWADTAALLWSEVPTGVNDADRGLSAATNEGCDSLLLWASYYNKTNNLRIDALMPGVGWRNVFSNQAGTPTQYTSIGAYKDTILCALDFNGAAGRWCRYWTSYNGGASWVWRYVDPDTLIASESPAVTLRDGGGEGVIYRYYTSNRELRYTWRRYTGGWSTPVAIATHPWSNQPAIQYLGSGMFGVAYVVWNTPVMRQAFFDRSDWAGVAEQRRLIMDEGILNVAPNPVRGSGRIAFTLNRAANLAVRVYDGAGRVARTVFQGRQAAGRQYLTLDASDLAPGVYFVRADADGSVLTVPVTVVK